ncbi:glycoside hydrolase family 2 TIM barrel-domain containing protein [Postechiella marina]|uniref:Glycoside hydrolase family 2 TIM barrel-domain containing protein n=1 Tax=Postechiella marina TaxID=943941 RepID=A0ABP8CCP0_9FLAO
MKLFGKPVLSQIFKLIIVAILVVSFQSCDNEKSEIKISINQDWKFKLLEDSKVSDANFSEINFDDSNWNAVSLPHTANIEPLVVNNQWQGTCWYRKSFSVPEFTVSKRVWIELEAAMNHSKLWVNGSLIKIHQGGYLPVVVDVTNYIKRGAKNVLAVRLNNTDNAITGPKPLKRLDFNMFSGLYRNAWLIIKDNVHISHPVLANKVAGGGVFVTYPKVSKKQSVVNIKTHVINEDSSDKLVKIKHSLFYNGALVTENTSNVKAIKAAGDKEFSANISLNNAKLWSPKNPNLYVLETEVLLDDKVIDKNTNTIGIRDFVFKNNKLFINGEETFLRGVNRHQEYPYVGYALSDNAQYRDAKKIKDAGFNYIRLSHYPQSPAFMDACDALGLVVIDAILGWQYYLDNDLFREYCYQSATNLIRRDRNRPSVLAWEVSLNETKMPIPFMEELDRIVHAEYPGENVYSCGWMDDVYDIYLQARQHRILHPHELKDKPYSVSEYGDWEYYSKNAGLNQDKLPNELRDEYSSRQARKYGEERLLRQAYNLQESHNDNLNTAAYSDSYWVMYDYNRGYYDNLEESGIMDIFRLPKFGYYFYKSQKDPKEEPVVNIASYWNGKSPLDIRVYSNCEVVSFYLNNILVATQTPDKNKNSTNLTHPPFTFKMTDFERGEIKAVGLIDGKEVASHIVKTPSEVTNLKIWLDTSGKEAEAGCNDVLFLYVAGIDDNGTVNPDFSEEILLDIDGDVEILNVEKVKAEAGIATALIKIGYKKGTVKVTAKTGKTILETYSFNVK